MTFRLLAPPPSVPLDGTVARTTSWMRNDANTAWIRLWSPSGRMAAAVEHGSYSIWPDADGDGIHATLDEWLDVRLCDAADSALRALVPGVRLGGLPLGGYL